MSERNGFPVIYADPPWQFRAWTDKGKNRCPDFVDPRKHGLAERHYSAMDAETLFSLPVKDVAAKHSILFLWAVDCMLPQAIQLGEAWGFQFKTVAFTWVKQTRSLGYHIGLGYWTRGNPEMCLLFTRGKPKRRSASVRQLIVSKRAAHSAKPHCVYDRIEQLSEGPYLEMFARPNDGMFEPRTGWTFVGAGVDGKDIADALREL